MSDCEVDGRAVLPQALKLVVGPLLFVLDVDDDVGEVDQHPAAIAFAFPAHRLDAELAKLVLDVVDDRADLAVVGSRRQNEDVGERELLADIQSDDLAGQLVLGGCGCSSGEVNGVLRGGHAVLLKVGRAGVRSCPFLVLLRSWEQARPVLADRACVWRCTARLRQARGTRPVRPRQPVSDSRWSWWPWRCIPAASLGPSGGRCRSGHVPAGSRRRSGRGPTCLLYTSDAADDLL